MTLGRDEWLAKLLIMVGFEHFGQNEDGHEDNRGEGKEILWKKVRGSQGEWNHGQNLDVETGFGGNVNEDSSFNGDRKIEGNSMHNLQGSSL